MYSDSRHWTTTPVTPTEEEISLLLKAAGRRKEERVDWSEIKYALDLWHSYVTNRSKIQKVFDKYDTDRNQRLEFDQLVNYLTDLNEGKKPEVAPAARRASHVAVCFRGRTFCSDVTPSHRTPRSGP